jgi:YNFM family putative membrane transporter
VIFSTIYTPQAILPILKEYFNLSITQTNMLLFGMLIVLMIATPFYAPLARRWQKKNIMIVATFFLFLSVLLSAMASNFYVLLFSRILQGIFIPGITAMMLSYVQDIYPPNKRGLGMGIYMAATSFGAVLGRLLAGWVTYLYSWRVAFAIFALLLFVALVVMVFGFPEDSMKKTTTKKENMWHYLKNRQILSTLMIPMVVFFSFMAVTTFITYHLSLAPFSLTSNQLGNLFLVLLVGVFVSPLAGRYSDKVGRIKILFFGVFVLLCGLIFTLSSSLSFVVLGIGLVTMGMFSVQSVAPTYIGELAPEDKATLAVLYQTFFYLGGALGTIIPSFIWKAYSYEGVVMLCFGLLVVGSTALLISTKVKV